MIYRICGNFRGSYILRITYQEDFRVLIFTDDLALNDYTALDYCLYKNFQGLKIHSCKPNSENHEFYIPRKLLRIRYNLESWKMNIHHNSLLDAILKNIEVPQTAICDDIISEKAHYDKVVCCDLCDKWFHVSFDLSLSDSL